MSSDPQIKLSPTDFAAKLRTKYPGQYDDIDDLKLTRRTLSKYPQYKDMVDLPDLDKPIDHNIVESEAKKFGLQITSGQRTPQHNQAVGGVANSYHLINNARDTAGDPQKQKLFYDYMRDTYGGRMAEILNEGDHIHIAWEPPEDSNKFLKTKTNLKNNIISGILTLNPITAGIPPIALQEANDRDKTTEDKTLTKKTEPYKPNSYEQQTADQFEQYKQQGNIEAANLVGLRLKEKGWEFGSTRDDSGKEWPYIKPPDYKDQDVSNQYTTYKGTDAFVNNLESEKELKKKQADFAANDKRNTIRSLAESGTRGIGATADKWGQGLLDTLEQGLELPTNIITEVGDYIRNAVNGQEEMDRRARLEESSVQPIERNLIQKASKQFGERLITNQEEEALRGQGKLNKYVYEAGNMLPYFIPTGAGQLGFGIESALAAKGEGQPLEKAILTGLMSVKGAEGAGKLAATLESKVTPYIVKDLVNLAKNPSYAYKLGASTKNFITTLQNTVGKLKPYAARVTGQALGLPLIQAGTGEGVPTTPDEIAHTLFMALGFGLAGHGKEKNSKARDVNDLNRGYTKNIGNKKLTPEQIEQKKQDNAYILESMQKETDPKVLIALETILKNEKLLPENYVSKISPISGDISNETIDPSIKTTPENTSTKASVKAFITKADEVKLRGLGYSDDDIYIMKPDKAQDIIDNNTIKSKEEETTLKPEDINKTEVTKNYTDTILSSIPKGQEGLSIEPRTRTDKNILYYKNMESEQHTDIVYRNKDGDPIAVAITMIDPATNEPRVAAFAGDKTKGLLYGKAVKAVGEELIKRNITKASGDLYTNDILNLINKAEAKKPITKDELDKIPIDEPISQEAWNSTDNKSKPQISNQQEFHQALIDKFNYPTGVAKVHAAIAEARATAWSIEHNKPKEEWYNTRLSTVGNLQDFIATYGDPLKIAIRGGYLNEGDIEKAKSGMRGVSIKEGDKGLIYALNNPNKTTAVHELAHIFRKMDLEGENLKTAEEWLGVKDNNWEMIHEEKFARGFESYLATGEAPTEGLKKVFEHFKQWMIEIYKAIKGKPTGGNPLEIKLSPEVKQMFDSLLGKEINDKELNNKKEFKEINTTKSDDSILRQVSKLLNNGTTPDDINSSLKEKGIRIRFGLINEVVRDVDVKKPTSSSIRPETNLESTSNERLQEILERPARFSPSLIEDAKTEVDYRKNNPNFQMAYHGSPHDFEKFDKEKIGTGEGAQAYGYGLYFAGKKEIAEFYKEKLSPGRGTEPHDIAARVLEAVDGDKNLAIKELEHRRDAEHVKDNSDGLEFKQRMNEAIEAVKTGKAESTLYKVDLAPKEDEYLLWDKPLNEQNDKVKEAIEEIKSTHPALFGDGMYDLKDHDDGQSLYETLKNILGSSKDISDYLHSLGIKGIKYLDNTSRSKDGNPTHNYVIFNDADVSIQDVFKGAGKSPETFQMDERQPDQPDDEEGTSEVKPASARAIRNHPKNIESGQAERSLPKTLEAHGLPIGDNLYYTVVPNSETIQKAQNIITEKGVDGAIEWLKNSSAISDEHTATGMILIDKLANEGNIAKASDIASHMSEVLTNSGRAIRAVQVLDKFTPARQLVIVQKQYSKIKPGEDLPIDIANSVVKEAQSIQDNIDVVHKISDALPNVTDPILKDKLNNSLKQSINDISDSKIKLARTLNELSPWRKFQRTLSKLNILRAIEASVDLSAPGRQGMVFSVTHPLISARAFYLQLQALKQNPEAYKEFEAKYLYSNPLYDFARQAGTEFTTAASSGARDLSQAEEAFMTGLFEDLAASDNKVAKAIAFPVVRSEQAYVTFLNHQRMSVFELYHKALQDAGIPMYKKVEFQAKDKITGEVVQTTKTLGEINEEYKNNEQYTVQDNSVVDKNYQYMADFINKATGRGNLGKGKLGAAVPFMNSILFSPKYVASRFQLLAEPIKLLVPKTHLKILGKELPHPTNPISPTLRLIIAKDLIKFTGVIAGTLFLANQLKKQGQDVETTLDPEDPDFLKLRIGTAHYDISGGFQGNIKILFQLTNYLEDQYKNKTLVKTGPYLREKGTKAYRRTGKEEGFNYLVRKLAPLPGYAAGVLSGKSQDYDYKLGKPRDFDPLLDALKMFEPIQLRDFYQAYNDEGAKGLLKTAPGALGIGTQLYKKKK